jgi:uncharacterized protein YifN (PemK superfamily)
MGGAPTPVCCFQLEDRSLPITFAPERRQILMCNFRMARIHPEMDKSRRIVVVSPRSYNDRHGAGPGRCVVVPFTATDPGAFLTPADVPFSAGVYECLSVNTWAICSAAISVSHARLDRVHTGAGYRRESLSLADMERIENGLRHALGLF